MKKRKNAQVASHRGGQTQENGQQTYSCKDANIEASNSKIVIPLGKLLCYSPKTI